MGIRTSSAREVDALLEQLKTTAGVDRDAAIARLRIIGPRAHDRVMTILADGSAHTDVRLAALRVLEGIDDPRVRRVTVSAADDRDPSVAVTAIQMLRPWLADDEGAHVLEAISSLVTDDTKAPVIRQAALDALSDLPASLTGPLTQQVVAQISPTPVLDDAASASEWLASHADAPLGMVHDVLTRARDRQAGADSDAEAAAWLAVRATAHATLARRGSRIGLYDARELFERAQRALPLDLLLTMSTVGDLTCLEALARSWDAVSGDDWWRAHVQEAAAAIATRENATGRHAAIRKVRAKWPGFLTK